jgi:hypothetical protein
MANLVSLRMSLLITSCPSGKSPGFPIGERRPYLACQQFLQVGAVEERGIRHADGEISVRSHEVDEAGKVLSENLRSTSLREVESFKRRARQRGQKVAEAPAEWVTYSSVFKGTFHFLTTSAAMRTAAKASYMSLVRHSRALAKGMAFCAIRDYIANCRGAPVKLFFNPSFAEAIAIGVGEHRVIIVLDGLNGKAHGIVVLFGRDSISR